MPSEPETCLYEYAIIRYVPRVEREEFVNVGLIMMCKRRKWIKVAANVPKAKWQAYTNPFSIECLEHQLQGMADIANGLKASGEIAQLPVEERFRWLTAVRSACIQTSRPHPGITTDLDKTFAKIYKEMVE